MGEKEGHDIHRLPFVKSIKLRRDRKVAECSSHGDRFCSLLSKYEIKSFFLSLAHNLNFETECLARYCASPGICHVAALRRRRRRFRSFFFWLATTQYRTVCVVAPSIVLSIESGVRRWKKGKRASIIHGILARVTNESERERERGRRHGDRHLQQFSFYRPMHNSSANST